VLTSNPISGSSLLGADGDTQVGTNGGYAALWHGTPESVVNLHPSIPGIFSSYALGVRGSQQVGIVHYPTHDEAVVWHGTAASAVVLHPPGASISIANATDGTLQGGEVYYDTNPGQIHAVTWNGSAASMVDLNPPGARHCKVHGMAPGQQVGEGDLAGPGTEHAALWSGTAASVLDLHPGTIGVSSLFGTVGFAQVGQASTPQTGGTGHAGLWYGTAASFIDLHAFLPAGIYSDSRATGVAVWNGQLLISGYAYRPDLATTEAFMWTAPVPSPGPLGALLGGALPLAPRRRR
jgi:hypothetical protein